MEAMKISDQARHHSISLLNPKKEIRAVLFDMDGVLVDSVTLHRRAWNCALEQKNLPPLDPARYALMLGRTSQDILTGHLDAHKISVLSSLQTEVIVTKEAFLAEFLRQHIQSTPGVVRWLDFFKGRQISCSVASSAEMSHIVSVLELLGFSNYFASIISGARLPVSKPHPMIFVLAAASLGVEPENCLVIEDAPVGIQAAKSANMVCCGIATTMSGSQLGGADLLLENLSEVDPETLFSKDSSDNGDDYEHNCA